MCVPYSQDTGDSRRLERMIVWLLYLLFIIVLLVGPHTH